MLLRYLAIAAVMIALISTALTFLAQPSSETSLIVALRNESPPPQPAAVPGRVERVAGERSAVLADRDLESERAGDAASTTQPVDASVEVAKDEPAPQPSVEPEAAAITPVASSPLPRQIASETGALTAIEPALGLSRSPRLEGRNERPAVTAPETDAVTVAARPSPTVLPSTPVATQASTTPVIAPTAVSARASDPSAYRVQLAAMRSKSEAEQAWQNLRRSHTDVLGALDGSVIAADLGSRGVYYRLRAGPFANRDRATGVCQALAAEDVECFVVATGGS